MNATICDDRHRPGSSGLACTASSTAPDRRRRDRHRRGQRARRNRGPRLGIRRLIRSSRLQAWIVRARSMDLVADGLLGSALCGSDASPSRPRPRARPRPAPTTEQVEWLDELLGDRRELDRLDAVAELLEQRRRCADAASVHARVQRACRPARGPSGRSAAAPASAPTSSANGRAAAGALYQASGSGPQMTSRRRGVGDRARTTPSTTAPSQLCTSRGTRPRLGLSPTRPQHEPGCGSSRRRRWRGRSGTCPPATAAAGAAAGPARRALWVPRVARWARSGGSRSP